MIVGLFTMMFPRATMSEANCPKSWNMNTTMTCAIVTRMRPRKWAVVYMAREANGYHEREVSLHHFPLDAALGLGATDQGKEA